MLSKKPIILGLSVTKLTELEEELFFKHPCVGYILFSRNIESKDQVQQLIRELKNLHPKNNSLIFIDQEEGRVARIKPPIAEHLYPVAKHFADIYDKNKLQAKKELKANYIALMSELKKVGIDSPCAPVCDIIYEGTSDIIGNGSFGNNPDKIIDLCKSAIVGISHA